MRVVSLWALVLIGGFALAASTRAQEPAPVQNNAAAPAGTADTGRKLFVSYGCWQCHGYEGQGGVAGPRLAPRPLAFDAFSKIVRRPPNQMPLYTVRMVSDADLAHIHAYLRSRPEPPPVRSIPLLQN